MDHFRWHKNNKIKLPIALLQHRIHKKPRLQIETRIAERVFELVNLNRFRIKIGKWPIELENLNEVEYGVEHKFIVIIDVIASVNASHLKDCMPFRLRFKAMTVTRGICQSINMNYPGDRVHFALHLSIKRNNSNCYPLERCCRVDEMNLQYWLITIKKESIRSVQRRCAVAQQRQKLKCLFALNAGAENHFIHVMAQSLMASIGLKMTKYERQQATGVRPLFTIFF